MFGKNFDVVTLGEALVDFTQAGVSVAGMRLFEQNAGGAPANVAAALSRLGKKTAFIGKVGEDMHGEFLRRTLAENGVDVSGLVPDKSVFTTLAFVSLDSSGERSFSFARKPGADTCLRPEELPKRVLEAARIFHFGSLSLTCEPARSAALEAVRLAKEAGALISFDPNYRASLWPDAAAAIAAIRAVLHLADIVKLSEEEAALVTGGADTEKAARAVLAWGPSCVVITMGGRGAAAWTASAWAPSAWAPSAPASAPAFDSPVVDTTGAGDAFWGGFLYSLLETAVPPEALSEKALRDCVVFANAAAACAVRKRGGIPSLPRMEEVRQVMNSAAGRYPL